MQKLAAPATANGPVETFTGEVWFDQIYRGENPSRARANSVHYAPCAHTYWHVHAVGQTLHSSRRPHGGPVTDEQYQQTQPNESTR